MLSEKLTEALNEQIGNEFYSGYFYLSMVAWFEENSLSGFANWMRIQTQEELSHAMIMFNFMQEAGGRTDMPAIEKPPTDYASALDVFQKAYEHEQFVTSKIYNLMNIADEEKNHAMRSFLTWFVDEQLEEEASFSTILGKLQLIEKSGGGGIFMLDNELGARTFTIPAPLAGKINLGI